MHDDSLDIVITGIGILAPNGTGRTEFWNALENGQSGVRLLDRFDASDLPCRIAGQLWDFDPHDYMSKADVKRWHRVVHQAVAAARLAVDDADFENTRYAPERVAVGIGTSISSRDEEYNRDRATAEEFGWTALEKFVSSASSSHAPTANVCAKFGFRGPAITIGSGCATGLDTITWGAAQIRSGLADAAVVGATESPITQPVFWSGLAMGILSQQNQEPAKAMRPFEKNSDGLVLAEAATVVILERADAAQRRGAPILAEVAGAYATSEGGNPLLLQRNGEALSRAIEGAIQSAGMQTQDVECVQSHGVGLTTYDKAEVQAYKTALGQHAYRVPISAVKSMTGQPYSVGGLFGVAGACMSLNTGIVPPTVNHEDPAEKCNLDFVPNRARLNAPTNVLVTAMSFGGTHSAMVLRKIA